MPAPPEGEVAAYYARLPGPLRDLALDLDALARAALPGVEARIRYGVPFYVARAPVCYVSVARAHVTFGLLRGADVPDASGLLTGTGKSDIRKATFRPGEPLPRSVVAGWLREARRLDAQGAG